MSFSTKLVKIASGSVGMGYFLAEDLEYEDRIYSISPDMVEAFDSLKINDVLKVVINENDEVYSIVERFMSSYIEELF